MGGTVAVAADMLGRYTNFVQSLTSLHAPPDTSIDFRLGADRGRSRNALVAAALERGSDWILFLDDDHSFPPDILMRLLARSEPVVASLYLQRSDPFLPIAYTEKRDDAYWPLDLYEHEPGALVPVVGAGTGGMLIRCDVFQQLPAPWFVHTTAQSEDLYFCDRLVEAEIPLYVDLAARLGHLTAMNVYPDWDEGDGGWKAALSVSPSMKARLPINMPG